MLTYHVVAVQGDGGGRRDDALGKAVRATRSRSPRNGGAVTVDRPRVVKTDIVTGNGVIHVIDSVIVPKDK